jgi:AcrR family transcriptional regulator
MHGSGRNKATGTSRNPEQTRRRILKAAKAEFARLGLGGARVDRIAERARVNKRMVADILGRGEQQGVFRKGVDPVQLNITIAALGYYYLTNRYTSSIIFDRDLVAPEALEARLAFIIDNVVGYLRP